MAGLRLAPAGQAFALERRNLSGEKRKLPEILPIFLDDFFPCSVPAFMERVAPYAALWKARRLASYVDIAIAHVAHVNHGGRHDCICKHSPIQPSSFVAIIVGSKRPG